MKDQRKIFGQRLGEVRKERGLSLKELANQVSLSESTISRSERGFRTERVPEELMNMIKKMISDKKIVELNPTGNAFLWNIRPDTFSTSYRNFLRRRNAPAYTFHELRHYQATWMFNQGFPDKYAARRMGQTEEVLRNTYQHLGLKKKEELDEKVVQITKAARK